MDFESLSADLQSHPITGYLWTGERLNIPLISHITDNLYVGGFNNSVNLGGFFSHVFSMYEWEGDYRADAELRTWTMYDSSEYPDLDTLDEIVPAVVEALEAGGNVLVHCQAGINRSNLVATLVLREWKGMTSREAVDLLREKRSPLILANETFHDYLIGLDA